MFLGADLYYVCPKPLRAITTPNLTRQTLCWQMARRLAQLACSDCPVLAVMYPLERTLSRMSHSSKWVLIPLCLHFSRTRHLLARQSHSTRSVLLRSVPFPSIRAERTERPGRNSCFPHLYFDLMFDVKPLAPGLRSRPWSRPWVKRSQITMVRGINPPSPQLFLLL